MAENKASFVFYESYFESMSGINTKKNKLLMYETICKYGLYGIEPTDLPPQLQGNFALIRPTIDAAQKRRKASISNGSKGGAPQGNQNARKQPKNNLEEQPQNNLNVNGDENADIKKDVNEDEENNVERLPHGKYSNVFLTDEEVISLQAEVFGWQLYIEKLSEYMESTGKGYQNHYATICKWAREDIERQAKNRSGYHKHTKADELNDFYTMAKEWSKA